jgi:hypothetical protein
MSPEQEPGSSEENVKNPKQTLQIEMRDVLEEARRFHGELAREYARWSGKVDNDRGRLLLEYMSQHQKKMVEALKEYEEEASSEALGSWFKIAPDLPADEWLQELDFRPDMDEAAIMDAVRQMDQLIIDAFERMPERVNGEDAAEAARKLHQLELEESTRASRATEDI